MKEVIINIAKVINDSYFVNVDDGQLVNDAIIKEFNQQKKVKLSFENLEIVTNAAINVAIGQLYGEYTAEFIKNNLSVVSIQPIDIALLKRTVAVFYADPEQFKRSIDAMLAE